MSAAFSAENLASRAGEAPSGTNMAFHPVLNLGVLNKQGREIQLFNPRSLVGGKTFTVAKGADARPLLVTFGGKGTKVVLWNGDNAKNPQEGLHFLPLELTAADRAALAKVYGKLPAAAVRPVPKATTSDMTGGGALPAHETEIAIAGFNDGKGLNADTTPNSPYPLGKTNAQGGFGERGWQGVWPANEKAKFVTDVVGEGDGALFLSATTNYGRSWSTAQMGTFAIETMVWCPEGGGMQCYVWDKNTFSTGPMWGVRNGKFTALNGNGNGSGPSVEICDCKPDTWYKVRLTIDTSRRRWSMAVDGKKSEKEFGFRYKPAALQGINFLVEGEEKIYLDAVRVLVAGAGK